MSNIIVGVCSLCGGSVAMHNPRDPWMSVNPPGPPRCMSCGAVEKGKGLPVLEMEKK